MTIHIWASLAVAFLLGILLRLFQRATQAYRSKLRAYPSRWAFVMANWDVFLLRTIPFNSGLFVLWINKPGLLSQLAIYCAVPANIANWLTVPPTLGSAIGFGYLVDLFLDQIQIRIATSDKLAWLPDSIKGEIPLYDEQAVNGTVLVQKSARDPGAN